MRRWLAFLGRHPWSVGLSLLSTLCFLQLADEVQEGELGAFDAAVAGYVARARGELDPLMLALTQLGQASNMIMLSGAVIALCLLQKRRHAAAFMLIAPAGCGMLNFGLKLVFHRARPDSSLLYLLETPESFSFPSGHAMGSAGVLGSLLVLAFALGVPRVQRVLVLLVCTLLALGVALSRVYFGVHYASDVLGGQLGAAAWVSAVTGWFYPRLLPGERSRPA